jgi:hypothetical protein
MADNIRTDQCFVWVIVWLHPQIGWVPWDFVRARRSRRDMFEALRDVKGKYPEDKFRLRKFAMVTP